jgi:hypothetical protein
MEQELDYVKFLEKKYKISLAERSRYRIFKDFEVEFIKNAPNMKHNFRKLVNIEDKDEQQESLHAVRQLLTSYMLDETLGLKQMGAVARSSSTRAYAGHAAEMRHIFDLKKLNLTEYARSFGLYKQLYQVLQKDKKEALINKKKGLIKEDPTSNFKSIINVEQSITDQELEKKI